MKSKALLLVMAVLVLIPELSAAETLLFSDDFNNGLGQWTGREGGQHYAVIVPDPLNSGRGGVLTFSDLIDGRDVYTVNTVSSTQPVIVRFDYLGLTKAGSEPGNFGGGVLIGEYLNSTSQTVLGGTFVSPGIKLVDDGQWHSYQVSTTLPVAPQHLVLKDLYGVPGDSYFDNLQVTVAVPEPSIFAYGLLGACVLGGRLFRVQRQVRPVQSF